MTTTLAELKTMLKLCTPTSILEEGKIDRRRGKISRGEFSSDTLEAGQLSDQEKVMLMTSIVPSGNRLPAKPRAAPVVEEVAVATTQITTTPHKESNQEEVEVSS